MFFRRDNYVERVGEGDMNLTLDSQRFVLISGVVVLSGLAFWSAPAGTNCCPAVAAAEVGKKQSPTKPARRELDIREIRTVSVLTPELASKVNRMRMRYALHEAGCIIKENDRVPSVESDFFPRVPIERHRIYSGAVETGHFSHNAQLAKFKGRYYLVWSTGQRDEAFPGQRVMVASSDDGKQWSPPRTLVAGDADAGLLQRAFGLYADNTQMVLYSAATIAELDAGSAGGRRHKKTRLDAHVTTDGKTWKKREGIVPGDIFFMEGPRPTRSGRLLAGARLNGRLVAFLWKKDDPAGTPDVVSLPKPRAPATIIGEGSWYQTDDGRILMWFRDERQSLRLFVAVSEDDGASWTEPMPTDFPDSMSRVRAGRLSDGRYYLIGNAFAKLMDRGHLMLALSDDGVRFNRMFSLLEEPTAQRAFGLLKANGYQYPVAIEDDGRLLIAYSINKEDIECAIVPLKALK